MIGRTKTLARASRFFGRFLAVVARLRRESVLLRVLCRRRCLSTQIYLFFYVLYKLFFNVLVAIVVMVG